jgi:hypothetical protein
MSQLNPTLGERRVGWYFIPSGNDVADGVKTQTAALIDLISAYEENDKATAELAQNKYQEACKLFVELLNNKK